MAKRSRSAPRLSSRPATPGTAPATAAPSGNSFAGVPRLSRRTRYAFFAAAAGAPLAALVLSELVLRLLGAGYPTDYLVPAGDGRHLTPNRRFCWQFGPRDHATQPYPFLLPSAKPPGTTRIFILGESAALGTPAPAFGFGRILETMLRQRHPERAFEVVNAALRGVNSHVVLPIARACARQSPDLFLVYLGNNEAVGLHAPEPEGVDWSPYLGLLRAGHWARALKVAQVADRWWRAMGHGEFQRPEQDMAFFRRHALPGDHPRRTSVYQNFRANLEDICRATRGSGAPAIVATLAVNLQDFPPLASAHRRGLTGSASNAWAVAYARGMEAEAQARPAEALGHYREAADLDDRFAELHYRMGRCALAASQLEAAIESFALARDWDALPFRADRRLNDLIRRVVEERHDAGLRLLDAERVFAERARSAGEVPGRRWFHEHVHLTFDGDYLLAEAFLPLVEQALGLPQPPGSTPGSPAAPPTRQECARLLAFTEWDEISVAAAMLRQTAKPPFLDQLDHAERQARNTRALDRRGQRFQEQQGPQRAVETYRVALAQRPDDWQIRMNFGSLLKDFNDPRGALTEFEAAVRRMPVFAPLRLLLAQALWGQGLRADAARQCQAALEWDPDYTPAREALAQLKAARP